jgi:hypothetical protein
MMTLFNGDAPLLCQRAILFFKLLHLFHQLIGSRKHRIPGRSKRGRISKIRLAEFFNGHPGMKGYSRGIDAVSSSFFSNDLNTQEPA